MNLHERNPSGQRNCKTTILVADDDSAILSFLEDVLRQHEFAVVTARDGAQALALARRPENKIDLLLTDLEMPHLNGLQLAAEIRQFLPRISVVLMSGSDHLEDALGGGSTFLRKPFPAHLLVETITGLLGDAHLNSV